MCVPENGMRVRRLWKIALTGMVATAAAAGLGTHGGQLPSARAARTPVVQSFESPKREGFYARWYRMPGVRHRTAVMLFGGSEGGIADSQLAHTLAARGYPVLDLAAVPTGSSLLDGERS